MNMIGITIVAAWLVALWLIAPGWRPQPGRRVGWALRWTWFALLLLLLLGVVFVAWVMPDQHHPAIPARRVAPPNRVK